jgi:hypothetical protein
MPESWTEDAVRREKARVPNDLVFKTTPDLALDLITRAVEDQIPGEIVLADAAFGNSSDFRNTVQIFGLDLGVAIQGSTKVWLLDSLAETYWRRAASLAMPSSFASFTKCMLRCVVPMSACRASSWMVRAGTPAIAELSCLPSSSENRGPAASPTGSPTRSSSPRA